MITAVATWASQGVRIGEPAAGPARGPLGPWEQAPSLSAVHPRARRPHPTAKKLVQLAAALLGPRRIDGLGLVMGTASGCAQADREFQAELDTKGWPLGGPSLFVYTLPTAALGEVSIALKAQGPMLTLNAGSASGLTAVVRGLEWVAEGRCPAALAISAELGIADEHVAMFLIEPGGGRAAAGECGFGELPSRGASAGALDLAGAVCRPQDSEWSSRDPLGYWARVTLRSSSL